MKRLEETVVRLDQDPRVVNEMGLAFVPSCDWVEYAGAVLGIVRSW